MATFDELRDELRNLEGLYGAGAWRQLLTAADVRAIDGYLQADSSLVYYVQTPTGEWHAGPATTGQRGYLDPSTGTFYPAPATSTGENPQVPDTLVGMLRVVYDRALQGGSLALPQPFLRTEEQQRGEAAEAIKNLEAAMVAQQDDVADADLRLAQAVMSAHATAQGGTAALNALQSQIDDYIDAHPGLDTPAGAREFQRFLITVMDEIAAVLTSGSLDAASQRSVLEALLQAYEPIVAPVEPVEDKPGSEPAAPNADDSTAEESTADDPGGEEEAVAPQDSSDSGPASAPSGAAAEPMAAPSDDLSDLMGADPDLLTDSPMPTEAAQTATTPASSAMPNLGGLGIPASSGMPSGMSSSLPTLPNLLGSTASDPAEPLSDLLSGDELEPVADPDADDEQSADEGESEPGSDDGEQTEVTLPNGETVTAPNPQIASAITAAASGTPVVEAYRANGMTITAAGTPVENPVDTADLETGDVGVFSDHHVIALGDSKALVNMAVKPVEDVVGPGFLGWERPPEPVRVASEDAASAPTTPSAPTRVTAWG